MNREIKFRAWHPLVKKMFSMFEAMTYQPFTPDFFSWHSENKWALMQFTGRPDKSGKDIYEGDIVEHEERTWLEEDGMPIQYSYRYSTIVFKDKGFWVQDESFGWEGEDLWDWSEIKVIGNIYENPELLDTKKAQLSEPKV